MNGHRLAVASVVVALCLLAILGVPGRAAAQPFNIWASFLTGGGHIAVPSSPALNPTGAFTFEAWVFESSAVAVQEVEVGQRKDLHDRYAIEAVPMVLIADDDGDVRASFIGAPTAADLWAALAELREPGSTPAACDHHQSAPST